MEDMTLQISIFGEITTAEAFNDLAKGLSRLDQFEGEVLAARQALVEANLEGKGLVIEEDCYNYRRDVREELLKVAKKHKLHMVSELSEGGMHDPGDIQFARDGWISIKLPVINQEVAVGPKEIQRLRKDGMTSLDQLEDFISNFKTTGHPAFSVADEVIAEIFLPKRRS